MMCSIWQGKSKTRALQTNSAHFRIILACTIGLKSAVNVINNGKYIYINVMKRKLIKGHNISVEQGFSIRLSELTICMFGVSHI